MDTKKETIDSTISHPMEAILDLEDNSTVVQTTKRTSVMTPVPLYDDKDDEIEKQFQEVYDLALDAFEDQSNQGELVEGKYKARNGEIASQYLNTALNAAKLKGVLKEHKDKLVVATSKIPGGGDTKAGDVVVGDRNDILKALLDAVKPKRETETIDVTPVNVDE